MKRLCALALATAVILLACVQTGPAPGEGAPETGQKQELEVFDPASYTREMMLEEQATRLDLEQIKQEYQQMISNLRDGDAKQFV